MLRQLVAVVVSTNKLLPQQRNILQRSLQNNLQFLQKSNHLFPTASFRCHLSTSSSSSSSSSSSTTTSKPPYSLTKEMAFGIQNATELFVKHGVGMQKLKEIAKEPRDTNTLVHRWQRMMEAYLGSQVHVLAGLGYPPNENGLCE
jgi:activator of HSP90 ATPase